MLRASLILIASAGLLAAARYSVWPARSYREWWVALFATELGHVWSLLAAALAAWATGVAWTADGALEKGLAVTAGLASALAVAGFARPACMAWRIGTDVRRKIRAAFGAREPNAEGPALWSWARLWRWPTSVEPVPVEFYEAEGRAVDFYRAQKRTEIRQSKIDEMPGGSGSAAGGAGAGAESAGVPCVVLVHGGGWDGGDRTELAGLNRWLAARGVAVAAFDYRLAPEHPWPAQAEDLSVVVKWIRENAARLGVDPDRLTLLGRSAGGQIAVATAYGRALPGVRAVVALYACHDMEFVWSIRSEHDALNSHKLMTQFLGGGPEGDAQAARFRSASGERLVHAGAPKTLLIHGALDELVWCRHSERLASALERAGAPHVFIKLPWATHAGEANLHGPSGQIITEAVLGAAEGR